VEYSFEFRNPFQQHILLFFSYIGPTFSGKNVLPPMLTELLRLCQSWLCNEAYIPKLPWSLLVGFWELAFYIP